MQNTVVQYKIQYCNTKYSNAMQNTVVLRYKIQQSNAKYSICYAQYSITLRNTALQCKIQYFNAKYITYSNAKYSTIAM